MGLRNVMWYIFVAVTIASRVVSETAWMEDSYEVVLVVLAVMSVFCASSILMARSVKRYSAALVAIGLVIGQWHFVLMMASAATWNLHGFAP